jgi:Protein of unknown function (DUF742)
MMISDREIWLDREAGPVVRPYALTRGRSQPRGVPLGLVDVVAAASQSAVELRGLGPEHRRLLDLCRNPIAVADLASEIDLPVGVVRVLLGDLCQQGLVSVVRTASTPEERVLRSVLDGLRAL